MVDQCGLPCSGPDGEWLTFPAKSHGYRLVTKAHAKQWDARLPDEIKACSDVLRVCRMPGTW